MMEWISVKEKLPEKSMKVRWLCEDGVNDVGFFYADKQVFGTLDMKSGAEITHWMPLPEPPKK